MFSKFKTRMVMAFLDFAAKMKSKAETARGERIIAIRKEGMQVIEKTNKLMVRNAAFIKAVTEHVRESEKKACDKAAEKYNELELMEMELAAK